MDGETGASTDGDHQARGVSAVLRNEEKGRSPVAPDGRRATASLEFPPNRLYGRMEEVSTILDAYVRVTSSRSRSEMVLISGSSGSGKSSLVRQLRGPFVERGGYFLSGKFDLLQQVEPLSAIAAAFTEYCKTILESGGDDLNETREAIHEQVGSDGASVLIELIPGLQRVMGGVHVTGSMKIGSREAQNRFKHMFQILVRAITGPSHPLVLFLDDLQWSDKASLDLVKALVTDDENSLLVIGCYRGNDVDGSHPLSRLMTEIEKQHVTVTEIQIGGIDKDAMNDLISDTLCAPRNVTLHLTDVVYQRTNGNAFFAIQFLKSLCEEGLLKFCDTSMAWRWEIGGIQSRIVADTALDLLTGKVLKLTPQVRGALEVAACLGHHCEETTLALVADLEDDDCCDYPSSFSGKKFAQMLDVAVVEGLMERKGSKFEFVHDQIQHAIYNLIPKNDRGALHLRIGKRIWKRSSHDGFDELLFVVVDQIYLGSMFVDEGDKIEVAELYLKAGRKAMSMSLFPPASTYLRVGIDLLGPGHWERQYELSLHLYESCAEADYCNGYFDQMGQLLDEIFLNARSFREKLRAYSTLVDAYGAMDKVKDAIDTGFSVLEELGEVFPESDVGEALYKREWLHTRDLLEEYSDETLLEMKLMEDEGKIAAMEFLNRMVLYTHLAKQEYFPLIAFRMMQLSLKYGVCKESAFAFAVYGTISCVSFDDVKRGYQFGCFALSLLERLDSRDCLARVYGAMYAGVNHWSQHVKSSLEPLLYAYQTGLKFGDIEYAMANARQFCLTSFLCGKQLALLEDETRVFCEQMVKYKQDTFFSLTVITRQTIQNLMGRSDDPMRLNGDAMNQDQMMEQAFCNKNVSVLCYIYLHHMWLALFFGDYDLAADMAEKSQNVDKLAAPTFAKCNHAFFHGVVALSLARKTMQSKWRPIADLALKKLKNWAVHAPCNFQHKVVLLEAEVYFLEGMHDEAMESYDSAISMAGENGFMHEQALACERAAMFCLETGRRSRAQERFDQAYELYVEWGAIGKAEHLRSNFHLLQ